MDREHLRYLNWLTESYYEHKFRRYFHLYYCWRPLLSAVERPRGANTVALIFRLKSAY